VTSAAKHRPSLSEAVAAYRQQVLGKINLDASDDALLRHLGDDQRAQQALLKILAAAGEENKAAQYFPFIGSILSAKCHAKLADVFNSEIPVLKRKAGRLEKALRRKADKHSPPEALERVAHHLRTSQKIGIPTASPDPMLTIRSDRDGSRQRVLFMRILSDSLHDAAGRWFDSEVADLTDIAFPGIETTADAVRSARRPSTRKGRRKTARP
jgi:hypothetical protein